MNAERHHEFHPEGYRLPESHVMTKDSLELAAARPPAYFEGKSLRERFHYLSDTVKIYQHSDLEVGRNASLDYSLPTLPVNKREEKGVTLLSLLEITMGFGREQEYIEAKLMEENLQVDSPDEPDVRRLGTVAANRTAGLVFGQPIIIDRVNIELAKCRGPQPESLQVASRLNQLAYCLEVYEGLRHGKGPDDETPVVRRQKRKDAITGAVNRLFDGPPESAAS